VTANEVRFSEQHPSDYHLVRLYEFDATSGSGKFYRVVGRLSARYELTPERSRRSTTASGRRRSRVLATGYMSCRECSLRKMLVTPVRPAACRVDP
jgi:hypothetical protein